MPRSKPNANPAPAPRSHEIGVSVTKELLERLTEHARRERRTRSHAAALLIEHALDAQKAG